MLVKAAIFVTKLARLDITALVFSIDIYRIILIQLGISKGHSAYAASGPSGIRMA